MQPNADARFLSTVPAEVRSLFPLQPVEPNPSAQLRDRKSRRAFPSFARVEPTQATKSAQTAHLIPALAFLMGASVPTYYNLSMANRNPRRIRATPADSGTGLINGSASRSTCSRFFGSPWPVLSHEKERARSRTKETCESPRMHRTLLWLLHGARPKHLRQGHCSVQRS